MLRRPLRPPDLLRTTFVRYASRQSGANRYTPPTSKSTVRSSASPPLSTRASRKSPLISQNHNARSSHRDPSNGSQNQQQDTASSISALSEGLRATDPSTNSLLAPVHISSAPGAILRDDHPSTSILANSGLVVHRQIEMLNVFLGFEQANRYAILDAQGNHVGYMAEHDGGMGSAMKRQFMRTHRAFEAHVFDRTGREVLRFARPFSWINSRIRIYDPVESTRSNQYGSYGATGAVVSDSDPMNPRVSGLPVSDMRIIGEAQQVWAPLRRKYNLFVFSALPDGQIPMSSIAAHAQHSSSTQLQTSSERQGGGYNQFAAVDEPFLSWDFSLLDANRQLVGSVNRNFAGFAREIFTDTGVYALRMDSAGLTEEAGSRHIVSQTGRTHAIQEKKSAMSLDERAVMLATAVNIDFDYFSRHSTSGGMVMPMWIPWFGGETAVGAGTAGGVGAAETTGAVIGGESAGAATGALGRAGVGASGAGEGAMAGAGTLAGYEMMQQGFGRGDYQLPLAGNAAQQSSEQADPQGQASGNAEPNAEETWGQDEDDPWNQRGGGGASGGDGGGGEGGDGGFLDSFF